MIPDVKLETLTIYVSTWCTGQWSSNFNKTHEIFVLICPKIIEVGCLLKKKKFSFKSLGQFL